MDYPKCVAELLKHKNIDVNEGVKTFGATPLHIACERNYVECVVELLNISILTLTKNMATKN